MHPMDVYYFCPFERLKGEGSTSNLPLILYILIGSQRKGDVTWKKYFPVYSLSHPIFAMRQNPQSLVKNHC
jgi:hypothetical protein